jgi:AsmA protein
MARLIKILLIALAAFIGAGALASLALYLFLDPNDFRDNIASAVTKSTGREFAIEGDLSLSIFPWIAVEVGKTRLGNAKGFGDQPFLSFEKARLSVQVLPLLLRREIAIGTASLDGLAVNLAVAKSGNNNWDDLASGESKTSEQPEVAAGGDSAILDVANVSVSNARVVYTDSQAGSSFELSDLSFETGRIAAGSPFDFEGAFDFVSKPGNTGGQLKIRGKSTLAEGFGGVSIDGLNVSGKLTGLVEKPTDFNFDAREIVADLDGSRLTLGEMDMSIFGLGVSAKVEPFSYEGTPRINAALRVAEFSLKDLMRTVFEKCSTFVSAAMTISSAKTGLIILRTYRRNLPTHFEDSSS